MIYLDDIEHGFVMPNYCPRKSGVSLIGVGNRVRLGVNFVCTVCSASGPVVSVVGDDRSGDPLHERCDESDVYEGEVAQVDRFRSSLGGSMES